MSSAIVEVVVPQPEGCPGQYLRISGLTAAICYGCARFGLQGPQIEPKAALDPASHVWRCEDRVGDFTSHLGGNAS